MLPTGSSPSRSRRRVGGAGGRKRTLALEQIVDAAIKVLDADGPSGLSLNRVARELGVYPTTLYTYFRDVDAMALAVLDRLMADIPIPDRARAKPLRAQLVEYLMGLRGALVRHPHAMHPQPDSPAWRRQIAAYNELLRALSPLQQTPESLLLALRALHSFIASSAEIERQYGATRYFQAQLKALAALPPEQCDQLRRATVYSKPLVDPLPRLKKWLNELIDRLLPGIDDVTTGGSAK